MLCWEACIDELQSDVCHCGNAKPFGNPFCGFCVLHLSRKLRHRLWWHFNGGPGSERGYQRTITDCKEEIGKSQALPAVRTG